MLWMSLRGFWGGRVMDKERDRESPFGAGWAGARIVNIFRGH